MKPTEPSINAASRKEKTRIVERFLALILVFLMFASSVVSSEVLRNRKKKQESEKPSPLPVIVDDPEEDTVLYYLLAEHLPAFSSLKFKTVEKMINERTVYPITDAKATAETLITLYRKNYEATVDPTDMTAVTDAILHCFLRSIGDDYARYRTADEFDEHSTEMEGSFCGIGVYIHADYNEKTIRILTVYEGSPAEEAGICDGDYITRVDGQSVAEIGPDKAVTLVRGEEGTSVAITVLRGSDELTFTVTRAPVEEHNATYEKDGDLAVIRIAGFKRNTAKQFKDALDRAKADGVSGIVFDLRNNPGGYLDSVVLVLSYLVPDGTDVASFGDYMEPLTASDGLEEDSVLGLPCTVLCNGYTASAGELFTSAIRDYASEEYALLSAKIVGQTTFGKGIMQSSWLFTDGSAITLTVSFYNPPSGENYHGVGIEPDVTAEDDPLTPEDEELLAAKDALRDLIAAAQND